MKCQLLFSGKKKRFTDLTSAEFVLSVLSSLIFFPRKKVVTFHGNFP